MVSKTSISQKIGWAVFAIGGLYMVGLGWVYSWWMVPAANQVGSPAYSGVVGILWGLSVPLGVFIVTIGAALAARVDRRLVVLLTLLCIVFEAWRFLGTTYQLIPALFGIGGGLITLFFLGSALQWAAARPTLVKADRTRSDLRMIGNIFFVVAAWDLCGIFGIGNFVLRPELAVKFSVPIASTINSASGVMVLLILGWGFHYLGQRQSRQVTVTERLGKIVPQTAGDD